MPKPKKDKVLVLDGDVVRIETTVHKPGLRSRTVRGAPHITTTPDEIRVGCIRFTMPVFYEMIRAASKQARSKEPQIIHQVGNYGDL